MDDKMMALILLGVMIVGPIIFLLGVFLWNIITAFFSMRMTTEEWHKFWDGIFTPKSGAQLLAFAVGSICMHFKMSFLDALGIYLMVYTGLWSIIRKTYNASKSTTSPIDQTWSETPAAMAGVTRKEP